MAYIVEVARTTKKISIAWDVGMRRNLLMTALLVHVALVKGYFTVENVMIFRVMC